jgi:hypothetical protein
LTRDEVRPGIRGYDGAVSAAQVPAEFRGRTRGSATPRRQLTATVAAVSVLTVLLISCGRGSLAGRKDLSQFSDTLRSEAAEGSLLAQDAASGRSTLIYTHEHAHDLFGAASTVESSLRAAETQPGLEPDLNQLRTLAGRISDDLQRLSATPGDLSGLADELQAAARTSEEIDRGLR